MLLTKTTELALQSLAYLALQPQGHLANPQEIADRLGESTSYLSKVLRTLAKSSILKSHRGIAGGFELIRSTSDVTLLEIVEACQGTIVGNYCSEISRSKLPHTCGYHQAMMGIEDDVRKALGKWSIADIARTPSPSHKDAPLCKLNLLRRQ